MSFLNWFSDKPATVSSQPAVPDAVSYREHSRLKRHARRDQLYVAIRDAMTRAGVLSASYRFKVLSLDQPGEKFMVMLDLAKGFDGTPGQLAVMEALIIQNAKARCEVMVPAVYWRFDEVAAVRKPEPVLQKDGPSAAFQADIPEALHLPARPTAALHDEQIQADVTAVKQGLLAASPQDALAARRSVGHHGLPPPVPGIPDTEMPDSAALPALSSTQYGELR
ncbi:MAG: hypothetical protein MUP33_06135 [Polaromonas sp.]|nr:hypothetical protein [Polaromonas sp.]